LTFARATSSIFIYLTEVPCLSLILELTAVSAVLTSSYLERLLAPSTSPTAQLVMEWAGVLTRVHKSAYAEAGSKSILPLSYEVRCKVSISKVQ
jgi:hypothetical protein